MQEDAADALVGYPRSQLDAISSFLALQFRQDSVGPLLGRAPEGSNGSSSPHAAPAAAAAAAAAAAGSGSMLHLVMAVLGRQEQVQAADSTASPTSGGRGAGGSGGGGASSAALSLGELLASVQAACSLAFDCTAAVVSPTVQLAGSVALGAAPAALAAGYVAPGSGVAAAVAWEGQQHVLLLRGGGDEQGPAALEAALLQLPEGAAAADLAFYKEGQVALLLAWEGGCRLALLPQEQLGFVELPAGLLVEADALQLCEMLLSHSGRGATPLPPDCRQRALPYPRVQQPLAVSASRGVGCVLAGTQVWGATGVCVQQSRRGGAGLLLDACSCSGQPPALLLCCRRSHQRCPLLSCSESCCTTSRKRRMRRMEGKVSAQSAKRSLVAGCMLDRAELGSQQVAPPPLL